MPGLDLVLPSEAQWEYACRAGTTTATYAGELPDTQAAGNSVLDGIAWFDMNSGGKTLPVGQKRPNAWGLYDMLGNAFEWCADEWHERYNGAPADGSAWTDVAQIGPDTVIEQSTMFGGDPSGLTTADRVLRGGSWLVEAQRCRAAYRGRSRSGDRSVDSGFRPAQGQG